MYTNKGIQTKSMTANFSLPIAYNKILRMFAITLSAGSENEKCNLDSKIRNTGIQNWYKES